MRARAQRGSRVAVAAIAAVILTLLVTLPTTAAPQDGGTAATVEEDGARWHGRASASWYFLPDQPDYLIAIAAADRGPLHLEARYGYEDRKTGSLFAGWNLAFAGALSGDVVPMLGAVLGRTNGVAPGLELTLSWGLLQYYLETEVVIDLASAASSYFYAWSELSVAPLEWLRAGVVIQRTRVIETPREVTPGLLLGFTASIFDLTAYWFAPGGDGQYAAVSAGVRL